MFRFANPYFLNLFFLLPVLIVLYIVLNILRKRAMRKFADTDFYDALMPMRSVGRSVFKFILFLLALSSIIIALARPQFGSKLEEVKREGIELIIALDVSRSMLAEDIKPNRLERAKQAITTMVDKMQDDKIGMIVFAGDAYTQLPITTDYISAKIFLSNISTNMVSKQGTAIASAIDLGIKSFTQDPEASKVIVIISDGENHEGDAVEAAKGAQDKGVMVYTIGMGSTKGALIPVRGGGRASQAGYLQDRQGNPVMSRLNAAMLKEIAQAGGGEYYTASTGNVGLNKLYNKLNQLNKSEIESKVYSEYDDQFHYFLALALLIFLIDFLILERRNVKFRNISIFNKNLLS